MGAVGTHTLIQKITVGAAGAASVTFSSIPQTGYTDLKIVASTRSAYAQIYDPVGLQINGDTGNNYYTRRLYGNGASTVSDIPSNPSTLAANYSVGGSATASTFGNIEIYFPNAFGSTQKSFSGDTLGENNAATAYAALVAHLWTGTSAISSIKLLSANGTSTFTQFSTFSLYGITTSSVPASPTPQAQGGDIIVNDGTYWYHAFISSGTFTPKRTLTTDVLVVAGGGAGGGNSTANMASGGGGGAGGVLYSASQSLTSGISYTATVGGGGPGAAGTGSSGTNSSLGSYIATGGGYAGGFDLFNGATGGSGGGGAGRNATESPTGGSGTSGQGNAGGAGASNATTNPTGGGGGGAGAVGAAGTSTQGGAGGIGTNTYSSWLSVVGLGVSGYIAGGGGAGAAEKGAGGNPSSPSAGTGGSGGGGNGFKATSGAKGNGSDATANTGSGGGGSAAGSALGGPTTGGAGGSGLVIVRYRL